MDTKNNPSVSTLNTKHFQVREELEASKRELAEQVEDTRRNLEMVVRHVEDQRNYDDKIEDVQAELESVRAELKKHQGNKRIGGQKRGK